MANSLYFDPSVAQPLTPEPTISDLIADPVLAPGVTKEQIPADYALALLVAKLEGTVSPAATAKVRAWETLGRDLFAQQYGEAEAQSMEQQQLLLDRHDLLESINNYNGVGDYTKKTVDMINSALAGFATSGAGTIEALNQIVPLNPAKGAISEALGNFSKEVQTGSNNLKSNFAKASEELNAIKHLALDARLNKEMQEDISHGASHLEAAAMRETKDFAASLGTSWSSGAWRESAGQGIGSVGEAVVTGGIARKLLAKIGTAALTKVPNLSKSALEAYVKSPELVQGTINKTPWAIMAGLPEGGGDALEIRQDVLKTDIKTLEEKSPVFKAMVQAVKDRGVTDENKAKEIAREELADRVASEVFWKKFAISTGLNYLTSGFEKFGKAGSAKNAFATQVGEFTEESLGATGGKLSQNEIIQRLVNREQQIHEGAGRAGAEEGIGAFGPGSAHIAGSFVNALVSPDRASSELSSQSVTSLIQAQTDKINQSKNKDSVKAQEKVGALGETQKILSRYTIQDDDIKGLNENNRKIWDQTKQEALDANQYVLVRQIDALGKIVNSETASKEDKANAAQTLISIGNKIQLSAEDVQLLNKNLGIINNASLSKTVGFLQQVSASFNSEENRKTLEAAANLYLEDKGGAKKAIEEATQSKDSSDLGGVLFAISRSSLDQEALDGIQEGLQKVVDQEGLDEAFKVKASVINGILDTIKMATNKDFALNPESKKTISIPSVAANLFTEDVADTKKLPIQQHLNNLLAGLSSKSYESSAAALTWLVKLASAEINKANAMYEAMDKSLQSNSKQQVPYEYKSLGLGKKTYGKVITKEGYYHPSDGGNSFAYTLTKQALILQKLINGLANDPYLSKIFKDNNIDILQGVVHDHRTVFNNLKLSERVQSFFKINFPELKSFTIPELRIPNAFKEVAPIGTQSESPSETNSSINIYYGTKENGHLSNLAERPFTFKGHKFVSVEHAYQTLKSGIFNNTVYKKAWKEGKKYSGGKKVDTKNNQQLMHDLILESFKQNPEARMALLATGNAVLTHSSKNAKKQVDLGIWETVLPQILMQVRDELKQEEVSSSQGATENGSRPTPGTDTSAVTGTSPKRNEGNVSSASSSSIDATTEQTQISVSPSTTTPQEQSSNPEGEFTVEDNESFARTRKDSFSEDRAWIEKNLALAKQNIQAIQKSIQSIQEKIDDAVNNNEPEDVISSLRADLQNRENQLAQFVEAEQRHLEELEDLKNAYETSSTEKLNAAAIIAEKDLDSANTGKKASKEENQAYSRSRIVQIQNIFQKGIVRFRQNLSKILRVSSKEALLDELKERFGDGAENLLTKLSKYSEKELKQLIKLLSDSDKGNQEFAKRFTTLVTDVVKTIETRAKEANKKTDYTGTQELDYLMASIPKFAGLMPLLDDNKQLIPEVVQAVALATQQALVSTITRLSPLPNDRIEEDYGITDLSSYTKEQIDAVRNGTMRKELVFTIARNLKQYLNVAFPSSLPEQFSEGILINLANTAIEAVKQTNGYSGMLAVVKVPFSQQDNTFDETNESGETRTITKNNAEYDFIVFTPEQKVRARYLKKMGATNIWNELLSKDKSSRPGYEITRKGEPTDLAKKFQARKGIKKTNSQDEYADVQYQIAENEVNKEYLPNWDTILDLFSLVTGEDGKLLFNENGDLRIDEKSLERIIALYGLEQHEESDNVVKTERIKGQIAPAIAGITQVYEIIQECLQNLKYDNTDAYRKVFNELYPDKKYDSAELTVEDVLKNKELQDLLSGYALHFDMGFANTNRSNMGHAVNPTNNKLFRECYLNTEATADLSDDNSEAFKYYALTMLQGVFDEKPQDYATLEDAVEEAREALAPDSKIVKAAREYFSKKISTTEELRNFLGVLSEYGIKASSMKPLFIVLHNLRDWIRYLDSSPEERKNFTSSAYLDLDGQSNGYAMLGAYDVLGAFTPEYIAMMKAVGFNFGSLRTSGELRSEDSSKKRGPSKVDNPNSKERKLSTKVDLYLLGSKNTADNVRESLKDLEDLYQKENRGYRTSNQIAYNLLFNLIIAENLNINFNKNDIEALFKEFLNEDAEHSETAFSRSYMKKPFQSTGYGGGVKSIARRLFDAFKADISERYSYANYLLTTKNADGTYKFNFNAEGNLTKRERFALALHIASQEKTYLKDSERFKQYLRAFKGIKDANNKYIVCEKEAVLRNYLQTTATIDFLNRFNFIYIGDNAPEGVIKSAVLQTKNFERVQSLFDSNNKDILLLAKNGFRLLNSQGNPYKDPIDTHFNFKDSPFLYSKKAAKTFDENGRPTSYETVVDDGSQNFNTAIQRTIAKDLRTGVRTVLSGSIRLESTKIALTNFYADIYRAAYEFSLKQQLKNSEIRLDSHGQPKYGYSREQLNIAKKYADSIVKNVVIGDINLNTNTWQKEEETRTNGLSYLPMSIKENASAKVNLPYRVPTLPGVGAVARTSFSMTDVSSYANPMMLDPQNAHSLVIFDGQTGHPNEIKRISRDASNAINQGTLTSKNASISWLTDLTQHLLKALQANPEFNAYLQERYLQYSQGNPLNGSKETSKQKTKTKQSNFHSDENQIARAFDTIVQLINYTDFLEAQLIATDDQEALDKRRVTFLQDHNINAQAKNNVFQKILTALDFMQQDHMARIEAIKKVGISSEQIAGAFEPEFLKEGKRYTKDNTEVPRDFISNEEQARLLTEAYNEAKVKKQEQHKSQQQKEAEEVERRKPKILMESSLRDFSINLRGNNLVKRAFLNTVFKMFKKFPAISATRTVVVRNQQALYNLLNERFPGKYEKINPALENHISVNGCYVQADNSIYIINEALENKEISSEIVAETLVHETIHAALNHIFTRYAQGKANKFDKLIINRLFTLANKYLKEAQAEKYTKTLEGYSLIIQDITSKLSSGNRTERLDGLNEFIAYVLSDKTLHDIGQQITHRNTFTGLFKSWLENFKQSLAALLGITTKELPKVGSVATQTFFLASLLADRGNKATFNTEESIENAPISNTSDQLTLFSIAHEAASTPEINSLVGKTAMMAIQANPEEGLSIVEQQKTNNSLSTEAKNIFGMTEGDWLAASTVSNLIELSTKHFRSNFFIQLRNMYAYAEKNLKPSDLGENGEAKYRELFSSIGNFVGISLASPEIREVLNKLSRSGSEKSSAEFAGDRVLIDFGNSMIDALHRQLSGIKGKTLGQELLHVADHLKDYMKERDLQNDKSRINESLAKANEWLADQLHKVTPSRNVPRLPGKNVAFDQQRTFGQYVAEKVARKDFKNFGWLKQVFLDILPKEASKALHNIADLRLQNLFRIDQTRERFKNIFSKGLLSNFKTKPTEQQEKLITQALLKGDLTSISNFDLNTLQQYCNQPSQLDNRIKALQLKIKARIASTLRGFNENTEFRRVLAKQTTILVNWLNDYSLEASQTLITSPEAIVDYAMSSATEKTEQNIIFNQRRQLTEEEEFELTAFRNAVGSLHEDISESLNELISLQVLQKADLKSLGSLLKTESQGMTSIWNTLQLIQELNQELYPKGRNVYHNRVKGYIPLNQTTEASLVASEKDLFNYGYKKLKGYKNLWYSPFGATAAFSEGLLRHINPSAHGIKIKSSESYMSIGDAIPGLPKRAVVDDAGNVEYEECILSKDLLEQYIKPSTKVSDLLGIELSRLYEQKEAHDLTQDSVNIIFDDFINASEKDKKNLYTDLFKINDPYVQEALELFPSNVRDMLPNALEVEYAIEHKCSIAEARKAIEVMLEAEKASPLSPKVNKEKLKQIVFYVPKSMITEVIGTRNFSIVDMFTGKFGLSETSQKHLDYLIHRIMGKNAVYYLRYGEALTQKGVTLAKSNILVRSLVVGAGNLATNFFELTSYGISPIDIVKGFIKYTGEAESWVRLTLENQKYTAQQMAYSVDSPEWKRLEKLKKINQEAMDRLDIKELIDWGHLSTIENMGYTSSDLKLLSGKWEEYHSELLDKIPGLEAFEKFGLLTRNGALYTGLSKALLYGDAISKQILKDHLEQQSWAKDQIRNEIRDAFVDYTTYPGKTRQYLESIGMMWFWSYKMRMMRVVIKLAENNPLYLIMSLAAPSLLGLPISNIVTDSLIGNIFTNKLAYSIGPQMFFHSFTLNPWFRLF